jgi:hypothetical protein
LSWIGNKIIVLDTPIFFVCVNANADSTNENTEVAVADYYIIILYNLKM